MVHRVRRMALGVDTFLLAGQNRPALGTIALWALIATLFLLVFTDVTLAPYDEGIVLQGAVQMEHGAIPHRDFFSPYGPASYGVLAGLFAAFGRTLLIARLYDIVVRGCIIFVCGLTARRLGLRTVPVVGVMLAETMLLYAAGFPLYPVYPSILCALVGTLLLTAGDTMSDERPAAPRMMSLAAGVLTGLTAVIRYDIGFFLLLAHGAALVLLHLSARRGLYPLVRQLVLYGLGVALVFVPVALAGWAAGALPGFVHDIVRFAPANYARMRSLPWPLPHRSIQSLPPLVSYVPFLVVGLGAAALVLRQAPRAAGERFATPERLAIALLCIVAVFSLKGVVRVSLIHSLLALVPAVLLLPFLLGRRGPRLVRASIAATAAVTLSLIALGAVTVPDWKGSDVSASLLPARMVAAESGAARPAGCPPLPTLGIGLVDPDTRAAACYIAARTRADEPIFVGSGRHDKIYAGNAALYFVSDRRPATRWYHLEPGLQTRQDVQRQMVADLSRNAVRFVALDTRYDTVREPNDSARSYGVTMLDRFIASTYEPVASFGSITILRRRDLADAHS